MRLYKIETRALVARRGSVTLNNLAKDTPFGGAAVPFKDIKRDVPVKEESSTLPCY